MQAEQNSLGKVVFETKVELKNEHGLHMHPAMQFVDLASRFKSDVTVSNDKIDVDGKSIMQMSLLTAGYGTKLKIKAEGPDAEEVVNALRELVEVKMFGEPAPEDKSSED
jgi:phosphocarrier protein HPr